MKIVVLGASGILGGHVVQRFESRNLNVIGVSRHSKVAFDAAQSILLQENLLRLLSSSDVVVNCIGMVKHRITASPESVNQAVAINSNFPLQLAELSARKGFQVLQVATDCVYSGRDGYYDEDSFHDAPDIYGKTKSLGEVDSETVSTIRSSFLGASGKPPLQFFDWIMQSPTNAVLPGFLNHQWNGTTAKFLARIIVSAVEQKFFWKGTQHLVPLDAVSKCQLAELVIEMTGRDDIVIKPTNADVPVNRILATKYPERSAKLFSLGGFESVPSIRDLLGLGVV